MSSEKRHLRDHLQEQNLVYSLDEGKTWRPKGAAAAILHRHGLDKLHPTDERLLMTDEDFQKLLDGTLSHVVPPVASDLPPQDFDMKAQIAAPRRTAAWFAGGDGDKRASCIKCGFPVVVISGQRPTADYTWYCANPACERHTMLDNTADTEWPEWVIRPEVGPACECGHSLATRHCKDGSCMPCAFAGRPCRTGTAERVAAARKAVEEESKKPAAPAPRNKEGSAAAGQPTLSAEEK